MDVFTHFHPANSCLYRLGTDNLFDAGHVEKRWKFIEEELRKRKISVVSFTSDGDPKLLKAMKTRMNLLIPDDLDFMINGRI